MEAFKFSENFSHQTVCQAKTYDCPIPLCRKRNIKLGELEAHWANECDQVNLTCRTCHTISKRDGTLKHNCVEYLLKERAQEQAIIAKQKAEIQTLELILKEQALWQETIKSQKKIIEIQQRQINEQELEKETIKKLKAEIELLKRLVKEQELEKEKIAKQKAEIEQINIQLESLKLAEKQQ